MEFKILKSLFESSYQAILQVAIIMRSNKIGYDNFGYFGLFFIIVSLTSVSLACSKHINIEIHSMHKSHLESNMPVTCMNTLLYFIIIVPRIWSWALLWSYYGATITGGKTLTKILIYMCIYRDAIKGRPKGCVKLGEKFALCSTSKAGEHNFFTSFSHNLGSTFYSISVD